MSYDIWFKIDGKEVEFDDRHQVRGGTYQMGGTTRAWLNITYNYAPFYYEVFGERGIRDLYGMTANAVAHRLVDAIPKLGTQRDEDYWEATRGNAGAALNDLLALALMCPTDAVLDGD